MKKDEMATSKIEDLKKALQESEKEIVDLRIQNAQRKLKNGKSITFKRKEIAQIKTYLHQKELNNAG